MATGHIENDAGFRQGVLFKNFKLKNSIFPTDIDGVIELQDKLWIFFEIKGNGKEIPLGQRLFLERTVDALNSIEGKRAVAYIADHNTVWHEDIDAAACQVREMRVNGIWRTPKRPVTLQEAIEFNISHI